MSEGWRDGERIDGGQKRVLAVCSPLADKHTHTGEKQSCATLIKAARCENREVQELYFRKRNQIRDRIHSIISTYS